MSNRTILLVVTLLATGCAASGSPPVDDRPDGSPLGSLAWLAGAWTTGQDPAGAGTRAEEFWTPPGADSMLGVNRTIKGDRLVFFEFLRLAADEDGIHYLASPAGRHPPTRFTLVEASDQHVVFENPEHDFPQRIGYRKRGRELEAWIDGEEGGRPRTERWVYRRLNPPGWSPAPGGE